MKRSRPTSGRLDASMDLLRQIREQPLDPDYAVVAARGTPPSRMRWMLAVTLIMVGMLFTLAAVQTTKAAPDISRERSDLIDRVKQAGQTQDGLNARISASSEEIRRLRSAGLGNDAKSQRLRDLINQLDPQVGQVPVTGPGIQIVADDSSSLDSAQGQVLDLDLQQLANGLWAAGAEAVAINGHRLTAMTAIRGAGDAITVDYRSLTRPYRVDAIGDPNTLQSAFAETSGGQWWNGLRQNLGMRFDVSSAPTLTLPGDPSLTLPHAKEKK